MSHWACVQTCSRHASGRPRDWYPWGSRADCRALAASDPVLRMLRDVAGINQVLYGTDFPYQRRDLAAQSAQVLQRSALTDLERGAVLGGNAARLFPRLQSVLANGDVAMRRSAATQ